MRCNLVFAQTQPIFRVTNSLFRSLISVYQSTYCEHHLFSGIPTCDSLWVLGIFFFFPDHRPKDTLYQPACETHCRKGIHPPAPLGRRYKCLLYGRIFRNGYRARLSAFEICSCHSCSCCLCYCPCCGNSRSCGLSSYSSDRTMSAPWASCWGS